MNWRLEPPVRVGAETFCAIAENQISARAFGPALTAHGTKRPVILIRSCGDGLSGVDIDGQGYSAADIEDRFPGAIAHLHALVAALPNTGGR